MSHALRTRSLPAALFAAALAACSGGSSGSGTTVSLAVTDAASEDLSTFNIGLQSVELVSATGAASVSLLQIPTAVDFAALTDLSRVLNIASVPPDTYSSVEVTLLFDNDRVVINGKTTTAALLASDGATPLTGTMMLPIDFPVPLQVSSGNYVLELDLDLNQSSDIDAGLNQVVLEPSILPRVNRPDAKEHAIGGDLRTVVLAKDLFRIALESPLGVPPPVVEVAVGPGTVFQIDGACLLGAAGLSTLDTLPANSWVQAFGSVDASSRRFQASSVEAGTGSYNGDRDIVEGVIIGRNSGAGTDTTLLVRGHSNDKTHTDFKFNLDFQVVTSFANTKVVRRGSGTPFNTDSLNIGQKVRFFGELDSDPNPPHILTANTATDVARMEPTWVFGMANEVPGTATPGQLEINLLRVDQRDVSLFQWNESGANPPNPSAFTIKDPNNSSTGQSITATTPVVALGFFGAVDAAGADYTASKISNREKLDSLLLVRDRTSGTIVTTTIPPGNNSIDFTFSNDPPAAFEKAVIDMGFVGQTDVTVTGVSIVPTNGLGIYLLRDRTVSTAHVQLFLTFASFSQAVDAALNGGATLFNVGAFGFYDSGTDTIASALAGVTVQ